MFKTELIGNLTKKPELKTNDSGKKFCFFTVAVNLSKDKAEFVDCLVGGATAENVCKYLDKGSKVYVAGKFDFKKCEGKDKEGNKVTYLTSWTLLTDSVEFLSSGKKSDGKKADDNGDDLPF